MKYEVPSADKNKGETHCVMRRYSLAFDGLKNVNFIE